ncbi:dihydrofolate reductase [Sphingobium sp. TomMM35A]
MASILGYIATSLDGFIATADDRLDWLFRHDAPGPGEKDYERFLRRIRTIVMGRGTYDFLARDPSPWAYGEQRVIVVTSHPIANPKGTIETRSDIDTLISELRTLDDGDVWMLGGGKLQMAFIERGALDEIQVFVFPEIIGGGRPLFPATGVEITLKLLGAGPMPDGSVRMHYVFDHSRSPIA